MTRIGIGFAGAGRAVQAVHLPVLGGMADRLEVEAVWDPDLTLAAAVAARAGARVAADLGDLLDNPRVDVVALCSPARFHAEQAVAAMRARKRVVLVEKPLCTTLAEADEILAVSRATGVPVLVGAMHLFDPGWTAVAPLIAKQRGAFDLVRSSIVLPPNDRFETWATERETPGSTAMPNMGLGDLMRLGVLELAIHDLPLVRRCLEDVSALQVTAARFVPPLGFALTAIAGETLIDLFAFAHGGCAHDWQFEAASQDQSIRIDFTPSFVQAGSAVASIATTDTMTAHRPPLNGYQAQWRALERAANGDRQGLPSIDDFVADAKFAIDLANQAAALAGRIAS